MKNQPLHALIIVGVFVVVMFVAENAFEKVSRVAEKKGVQIAAAGCSPEGGAKISPMCIPAGPGRCSGNPKLPGKDVCPCVESGGEGGVVTGVCLLGMCCGQKWGSAESKMPEFKMPEMKEKSPSEQQQELLQQKCQGEILLPESSKSFECRSAKCQSEVSLLETEKSLECQAKPVSIIDKATQLIQDIFGGNRTNEEEPADEESPSNISKSDSVQTDPDGMTTQYEQLKKIGEKPIIGTSPRGEAYGDALGENEDGSNEDDSIDEFNKELDGKGLYDDTIKDSSYLSKEELELEEAERISRSQGNNGLSPYGSLTDSQKQQLSWYSGSSLTADSGDSGIMPCVGSDCVDYLEDETKEEPSFFGSVLSFFKKLFGVGAPK